MTSTMTDLERPLIVHGQWLDCSTPERTWVGCDTCGWEIQGRYDDVRPLWLAHTHDPLHDIRARLTKSDNLVYNTDVAYLLDLLERREQRD